MFHRFEARAASARGGWRSLFAQRCMARRRCRLTRKTANPRHRAAGTNANGGKWRHSCGRRATPFGVF